jgi:hypothetical protein
MALGKQGGIAKAPTSTPVIGSKPGGKVVGGGNRKEGVLPKPIAGNSKKPR